MGKQLALATWPDPRNVIQNRPSLAFLAPAAVTGDGKSMGLVTHLLE